MNLRVLSIRKHKKVTFINGYSSENLLTQYMIENSILCQMKCGDLIDVDCIDSLNARGMPIKKIIKVNEVVPCVDFESFKGINNQIIDHKYRDYLGARNCGIPLQIFKLKREIISKIKELLDNLDFLDVTGLLSTVEYYKNGSGIIDAEVMDREESEPKYLRVSLENQLKQISGITLESVYAIDKVYRNMGEDNSHLNEFLMLEFVSLKLSLDEIINFVIMMDEISRKIAQNYNFCNIQEELNVIDYFDVVNGGYSFEDIKRNLKNTLVINYPCESPFIKKDLTDNLRKEVRWYVNGHFVAHFYKDENQIENIREALKYQNLFRQKDNVNPLDYFEWGLPASTSFGLSVDRWIQLMIGKDDINSIANPLGIDYVRKLVRSKRI